MKFGVVIVTYNRLNLLKECLEYVDNQIVPFFQIVIVENHSTDGTIDYLKTQVDKYDIIFEKENGGGAKGFHDGIEYIHSRKKCDWVLVIDDDAMLSQDYIEKIKEYIEKYPSVKAFSGSVMTEGEVDETHRKILHRGFCFNIEPIKKVEYKHDFFEYDLSTFCGLLFSLQLIDEIGYPQKDYFIWYDDTEYCMRINKYTRIINVNSAVLNHKTVKATASYKLNWKGYYGIRNRGDMLKLYGNRIQFFMYYVKIRKAQLGNLFLYFIKHDKQYKYNATLYNNALNDVINGTLGKNSKYLP